MLGIGGITVEYGKKLGAELALSDLEDRFDAVFLGIGLAGVNALALEGSGPEVVNAVDWIAEMRQSKDKTDIAVGRDVVVIGGGMTAVDAAIQSRLLGAGNVTMAYRRDRAAMAASVMEQNLAASKGVRIVCNAAPKALVASGVLFARTETRDGQLVDTGETFEIAADQVMLAIGQSLAGQPDLALKGRKIAVDEHGRTSRPGVWAGGDCASGGDDLTVTAVAEGRDAAMDIDAALSA